MPAVRFSTTSTPEERIRSTTSRKSAGSREGPPVSGSRTWMCTIAAPALAASSAASAIWAGVTGTSSDRSVVAPTPVTAQVMKTSLFTGPTLRQV